MEIIVFSIIFTVIFIWVFQFIIESRKSFGVLLTSFFIYLWFVVMGVASFYKIQPLIVLMAGVFLISLFAIPVFFEFYNKDKEKKIVSSKDFIMKYNLESSFGIPDNIEDEILNNNGELDPFNKYSCFYDKSFNDCLYDRKQLLIYSGYEGTFTCKINELNIYLIDRSCKYKSPSRKRNTIYERDLYYYVNDSICIVESEIPVNIPDFILRDRIPVVDTLRYCLSSFDKKYISFHNDRDFSKEYVLESYDSLAVKDYFNFKIREVFKKNQLKNVTMLYGNNRLLVKFPYFTSMEEKRKLFNIVCALFNKNNDIFKQSTVKNVLKNNDEQSGSLLDYFTDSNGKFSIPPFLGGLIIFIMSLIVIALVGKYL